jgi:hypothetical protein
MSGETPDRYRSRFLESRVDAGQAAIEILGGARTSRIARSSPLPLEPPRATPDPTFSTQGKKHLD